MTAEALKLVPEVEVEPPWKHWSCGEQRADLGCWVAGDVSVLARLDLWCKASYTEDLMFALHTFLKGFPWTSSSVAQRTVLPVGACHLKGIQFDGSKATVECEPKHRKWSRSGD